MPTDDLSSRIAEHFEPKASIAKWRREVDPYEKSQLGWWWRGNGYNCEPYPYTDPEICLRLLKWLVEHSPNHTFTLIWIGKLEDFPGMDLEKQIAEAVLADGTGTICRDHNH